MVDATVHGDRSLRGRDRDGCPLRIRVAERFAAKVLALGGDIKSTICRAEGLDAWMSDPVGDLAEAANYRSFMATVDRMKGALGADGPVVACDLHPGYLSTALARRMPHRRIAVQHHHAHAVSCALDADLALPVIGIVCDGTGYGTDGAVWGGEILYCRAESFQRMAHLAYFRLPGGDAAARDTWRPALSILRSAFPTEWNTVAYEAFAAIDQRQRDAATAQLTAQLNAPLTSSLGRLFDAVAFLTGIRARNDFEGQAAVELQAMAGNEVGEAYPHEALESLCEAPGPDQSPPSGRQLPTAEGPLPNGRGTEGSVAADASGAFGPLPHGRGTEGSVAAGASGAFGPLPNGRGTETNPSEPPVETAAAAPPPILLDWRPMIRALVDAVGRGTAVGTMAARFHGTMIEMFAEAALRAACVSKTDRVVLSGGCFLNDRLREGIQRKLTDCGLQVGVHDRVSTGDAGLSLGQAFVAAAVAAQSSGPAAGG